MSKETLKQYLSIKKEKMQELFSKEREILNSQKELLRTLATTYVEQTNKTHLEFEENDRYGAIYLNADLLVNGAVSAIDIEDNGYLSLDITNVEDNEIFIDCRIDDCANGLTENLIMLFIELLENL